MMNQEYRFDWHTLQEHTNDDDESFLKWAIVNLMDTPDIGRDVIGPLSELTNQFTDVALTIQINGVDVDPQRFMANVGRNMRHYARVAAVKKLHETGEAAELMELAENLTRVFDTKARVIASQLGLLDEYDQQVSHD